MLSDKEKKVHEVFETISAGYDAANTRISLGFQQRWKNYTIDRICRELPGGGTLLDLCCGTGDMALLAAQKRPDSVITGVDFSDSMLKEASRRYAELQKEHAEITWMQGNATALSFPDETFDSCVISFGLRNTPDYYQVLSEIFRVLKKGGRIYCLDSFVPENKAVLPFYRLYFHHIMPIIGGGRQYRQQYRWLWQSTEQFISKERLLELMEQCRFTADQQKVFMFGACVMQSAIR